MTAVKTSNAVAKLAFTRMEDCGPVIANAVASTAFQTEMMWWREEPPHLAA